MSVPFWLIHMFACMEWSQYVALASRSGSEPVNSCVHDLIELHTKVPTDYLTSASLPELLHKITVRSERRARGTAGLEQRRLQAVGERSIDYRRRVPPRVVVRLARHGSGLVAVDRITGEERDARRAR